jgi:uncharacterized protein (TIGR02147 family)
MERLLSQFSAEWIKARLSHDYNLTEIQKSLGLLLELKLLQKTPDGKLARTQEHIYTRQDVKNVALQDYHKNVLTLASTSVGTQAIEKREYNATALGIRIQDMPAIKDDIRGFLNDFIKKYEAPEGKADEIYQLAIQLFALSENKDGTRETLH